jgi:large subunit ribosomal protein L24
VQTTLLGFAMAIILALVAALVGPFFVDWNSYRGEFEARASRLTGLEFHVTGAIDARLLPTPTIVLQGVEFGRPQEARKVRARALRVEFALGALMRGEWRIADARLDGPEFAAGLDDAGRLAWPVPKLGFDLDGVSIEQLQIQDGKAVLADAASDTRLALDHVEFKGELRSLAGPVKGEGSFAIGGQRFPYRLSTSRIADDGGMKVRLALAPADYPLAADVDVTVWTDAAKPRYEGNVQFSRPVARAPAGAQSPIVESWRVSARVEGDSSAAVLEQVEFQYGPDDRAIKLKGDAKLTLGQQPRITGVLSSPQIDADRLLGLSDAARGRPLAAVKALAESLLAASRLPIPATLSIAIESVTLGGATLSRVGADVTADAEGLDLKELELRAPGLAQLRLSGRLATNPAGVRFAGATRVESGDPRAFFAWLTQRNDEQLLAGGPLRLGANISFGDDAVAIDQLKVEFDRMTVAGSLAYAWPNEHRPARLDVSLTAPEIDLDRLHALARATLGTAGLEWPREGKVALKVERAVIAGIEARGGADVKIGIGADGLDIERLALADFGGATLTAKGRIGGQAQSPRGELTLDVDAQRLDGVAALLATFAPQAAEQLRRSAASLSPAVLRASLAVDPGAASAPNAKFKLDGRAGSLRLALKGDAQAGTGTFKLDDLPAALKAAQVGFAGQMEADDGGAFANLLGIDRFIAIDKRPARLVVAAKGALGGELAVDGQLAAGPLGISANGTVGTSNFARPTAALKVKVANANLRLPRPTAPGRPPELVPASLTAALELTDRQLRVSGLAGTVAGTNVRGQVALEMREQPIALDGEIELGAVNLPTLMALAIGVPAQGTAVSMSAGASADAAGLWPAEPFDRGLMGLGGQLTVKSARVMLRPKLSARDVRGILRFGEAQMGLQVSEGELAGGRVDGELTFVREGQGLRARSRIALIGVNAAELLPGNGIISGHLTADLTCEGSGLSPFALVGSLRGTGAFRIENARLVRLDPSAFDAVIRAVDQGLPIDAVRIRDRTDAALARGVLAVPLAEGAITIESGQARLTNSVVHAQRADLAASGSVDLAEGMLDARLTLSGTAGAGALADSRPEVGIALKGSIDAPKRSIDVAAFASWLALRAVEQQSKKLDVLEGRAIAPPAVNANAPSAPPTPHDEPGAGSQHPAIRGQPPAAQKPRPVAPSAERLQPLPPPVDIRPAPVPHAPRPQPGAQRTPGQSYPARPSATAVPPRPRSLSEILFGR